MSRAVQAVQAVHTFSDKRFARAYEATNGKPLHRLHRLHGPGRSGAVPLGSARKNDLEAPRIDRGIDELVAHSSLTSGARRESAPTQKQRTTKAAAETCAWEASSALYSFTRGALRMP